MCLRQDKFIDYSSFSNEYEVSKKFALEPEIGRRNALTALLVVLLGSTVPAYADRTYTSIQVMPHAESDRFFLASLLSTKEQVLFKVQTIYESFRSFFHSTHLFLLIFI